MKKHRLVIIAMLFSFILSGCGAENTDTADRIARPDNKIAPLQGTWRLEKCYGAKTSTEDTSASISMLLGTEVSFNGNEIIFGDTWWSNVSYKIKRVNSEEYFLHKYADALTSFNIKDREVLVITASSKDKFLYEFVKAEDDRFIVDIEDEYFCMTKISDGFKNMPVTTSVRNLTGSDEKSEEMRALPRSGLLLGFRVPSIPNPGSDAQATVTYKYATYWISSIGNIVRPVYYTESIYLPRMDGFWKLEMDKGLDSEGIEDVLTASMVSNSTLGKYPGTLVEKNAAKRIETKLEKAILYVGNDYVCVENTFHRMKQDGSEAYLEKVLRTLPVDNLRNTEGIKFSDLTGENGILAMEGAAAEVMGSPTSNAIKSGIHEFQEENFALFRKTGHWFFKGRVSLAQDDPLAYVDYNINLIPPPDMVAYDMLHVPWTTIKDTVPQAIDAYTSPNSDIAVIITRTDIILYAINGGALSAEPLGKYEIADGSSVIMAEWAVDDYVLKWEKSYLKNNKVGLMNSK